MLYLGQDRLGYTRVADAVPGRGVSYRYLTGPNQEPLAPDNEDYAFGDVVQAVVFRAVNLHTQLHHQFAATLHHFWRVARHRKSDDFAATLHHHFAGTLHHGWMHASWQQPARRDSTGVGVR